MKILTSDEINEQIRLSEGRAISYLDAPDWYCGTRKCTHMGRDGVVTTAIYQSGSCHALALSFQDNCAEYIRAWENVKFFQRSVFLLGQECETEQRRKLPRKKYLGRLAHEMRDARWRIQNSIARMAELEVKYFRGYEGRLLIADLKAEVK